MGLSLPVSILQGDYGKKPKIDKDQNIRIP